SHTRLKGVMVRREKIILKHHSSKLIRIKPINTASAQKIIMECVSPLRAVLARAKPAMTALIISIHQTKLAPCSQCCIAVSKPSRLARNSPRACTRCDSEPWVLLATRHASLSSNRPVWASRKRTVSHSQRVCKGESESVTSIPLDRVNSTIVPDYNVRITLIQCKSFKIARESYIY